jgi:hypothetical protein
MSCRMKTLRQSLPSAARMPSGTTRLCSTRRNGILMCLTARRRPRRAGKCGSVARIVFRFALHSDKMNGTTNENLIDTLVSHSPPSLLSPVFEMLLFHVLLVRQTRFVCLLVFHFLRGSSGDRARAGTVKDLANLFQHQTLQSWDR